MSTSCHSFLPVRGAGAFASVLALATTAFLAPTAHAAIDTLYTNFSAGSYDTVQNYILTGTNNEVITAYAAQFTPTVAGVTSGATIVPTANFAMTTATSAAATTNTCATGAVRAPAMRITRAIATRPSTATATT